jgi:hypothetical protein
MITMLGVMLWRLRAGDRRQVPMVDRLNAAAVGDETTARRCLERSAKANF